MIKNNATSFIFADENSPEFSQSTYTFKSIDELKNRLKVIEEKSQRYKKELDSVRKELRGIQKTRKRLESDREQLRTGSR